MRDLDVQPHSQVPAPRRREQAAGALAEWLRGRQIVVVSNREPYVHRRTERGVRVARPSGGLVEALDPVMQAVGGVWVAWGSGSADRETVDAADRVEVPPDAPRYALRRVWLPERIVEHYYYGFANQALWPLCHMAVDKARFRRRYWHGYVEANRLFAAAVLEEASPGALVWLQDYHLALCPRQIRAQRDDVILAHFWHIPWPAWDVFRACPQPQRRDLLDGLLANDLLGFHLNRFRETFLECVEHELDAEVDFENGFVDYRDHRTTVRTFPISIDVEEFDRVARSPEATRWMAHWRRRFGPGRRVAVAVDRLDYTKGIPERLRAIDRFLSQHPQLAERIVFVQKAAPSRTLITAYRQLQRDVERQIADINARHGRAGWRPIVYLPDPIPRVALAALYRVADVAIVSSLQDGMNLVAKEFIACQVDEQGVLLLSELAGAVQEMAHAIRINPYDEEGFAEAIAQALAMAPEERRQRIQAMRAYMVQHDVYRWMGEVAANVARLVARRMETRDLLEAPPDEWIAGDPAVLFLDYDGTLVPIAPTPEAARPAEGVREVLWALLARGHEVVIVSGRRAAEVREWLDIDGLVYMGNHGLEVLGGEQPPVQEAAAGLRDQLGRLAEEIRARLGEIAGLIVEEKGYSVSVHYRLVAPPLVGRVTQVVRALAERAGPWMVVTRGKRVLELRPSLPWDKGRAVLWWLESRYGPRWSESTHPIYIGDDRTDEDAFAAINGRGITVAVAPEGPTAAAYYLRNPGEVLDFLRRLAGLSMPGRLASSGSDQPEPVEAVGPQREEVG